MIDELKPSPSSDAETDVLCPLCDYNLRGLAEPRCPECGAAFDWDELRDPARRKHPYLFEHHPERPVDSFVRTLLGGLRPWRFWKTLYPGQPSFLRRLMVYWVLCILIGSTSVVLQFVASGTLLGRVNESYRSRVLAIIAMGEQRGHGEFKASIIKDYGSLRAYFDYICPRFPSGEYFKQLFGVRPSQAWRGGWAIEEPWCLRCFLQIFLAISWPITTVLVLMLLRVTMRRAQVRRVHLLRVAVYCADVSVWLGLLLLVPAFVDITGASAGTFAQLVDASLWLPVIALFVLMIRLTFAISRYLRFRHAFLTSLAVQIVFALMVMKLLLMLRGF